MGRWGIQILSNLFILRSINFISSIIHISRLILTCQKLLWRLLVGKNDVSIYGSSFCQIYVSGHFFPSKCMDAESERNEFKYWHCYLGIKWPWAVLGKWNNCIDHPLLLCEKEIVTLMKFLRRNMVISVSHLAKCWHMVNVQY